MNRAMTALQGVLHYTMMFLAFSFVGLCVVVGILWQQGFLSVERLKRVGSVLREDPNAPPKEEPKRIAISEEAQREIELAGTAIEARERRLREEIEVAGSALRTQQLEIKRERDALEAERAQFDKLKQEQSGQTDNAAVIAQATNFRNNLRILSRMSSKDAAAFLKDWDAEDIVMYVRRLRDKESAKLLVELDTTEARKAKEVRDLLRAQGDPDSLPAATPAR